jgi:acetyl esterase/lipase
VSLANAQTTNPRFTAPNIRNAEQLTFELTATGAASARALDSVMVEVKPRTYSAGGIVASEEIASVTNGRVWKVRYRSTTLRGESIIVSGWIAKPKTAAPEGGYPVLAFAHGTTGLADSCAPTNRSTPKATIPLLEDFLARGFVVAATDYQGLGEEGLHHYLVGPDEARSVLDSARAARQFAGASAQVVLFGHSQGGHAVIFANELARTLAPELQIMGTIGSGTGIADSTDNMLNYIKDSPYKGYLVMAGLAQNAAYGDDEVPLSSWFTPAGLQAAQAMNSICVDQLVSTYANLSSDYLFVDGFPLPGSGKYNPEADAVPGLRVGVSPLLMVHGRNDPQIRPDFLIPWVEDTCARGQPINLRWFDTGHRVPYEAPSAVKPVIADWIEDRFAGVPVVSDCGSVPRP